VDPGVTKQLFSIGDVAAELKLSTRTLRYYEQIGLLHPTGHSAGGARRYTDLDVQRVAQIRRFQSLMGFDLDRIRELLEVEDALARLRAEYRAGAAPERSQEIVTEALALYDRMRDQVREKLSALEEFLDELDAKVDRAQRASPRTGADTAPVR
jgi:DNA-binding transcriptional MerR regulator